MSLIGGVIFFLTHQGFIWLNNVFTWRYPTQGLDVSHHQGQINWSEVAATNQYSFVYMKATEGHDFIDPRFAENWPAAHEAGLAVGAYHFFSMRSSGQEQAEYFIEQVPADQGFLRPVLDIEIALDHEPETVRQEIRAMAVALENYYGQQPILYVTYDTYHRYIQGELTEYDLWVRDVLFFPTYSDTDWIMWQYSNRGHVAGIDGFVDKNVLVSGVELLK